MKVERIETIPISIPLKTAHSGRNYCSIEGLADIGKLNSGSLTRHAWAASSTSCKAIIIRGGIITKLLMLRPGAADPWNWT